ncbi:hypothetical protein AB1Y20_006635 [Prymnesium parvum]|uniref:Uncharacterized protein n=1 Tax=Prymnesium parvum TaxID=97485 RepID=A0AB34J0C9_PRYPA
MEDASDEAWEADDFSEAAPEENCEEDSPPLSCIVVGAGWTGLATAAALRAFGVRDFVILESGNSPGSFWSQTYDRIRLHTPWHGLPCDGGEALFDFSMFKTREQVIKYLSNYHTRHSLHEHSLFGHRVRVAEPTPDGLWRVHVDTPCGPRALLCRRLAMCTSKLRRPYEPKLAGREAFPRCLHSSAFKSGADFRGARVLVVGCGNSGCEIALDLSLHGAAEVTMLVAGSRQFVNFNKFTELMQRAMEEGTAPCIEERAFADWSLRYGEPGFAEACAKRSALMKSIAEDTSDIGIQPPGQGFGEAQVEHGRIGVFDCGVLSLIRAGKIRVHHAPLSRLDATGAVLSDGTRLEVDAIILATGFEPSYEDFFTDPERYLARGQKGKGVSPGCLTPRTDGNDRSSVNKSLYFVGSDHAVNGGMAMGMQGWSCGFRIAQSLGLLPANAKFTLDALPERQRDIIATRRQYQNVLRVSLTATALLVGFKLSRHFLAGGSRR